MKASITYYLNASKKSSRTGKIPIYARISLSGEKAEYRLNAEVTETEVSKWDQMTMRLKDRSHYANHILNDIDNKFQQFLIINSWQLNRFTAKTLRDKLTGQENSDNPALIVFVEEYFEKAVAANKERSPGTVRNYRKAINHLKAFLNFKTQKHMLLSDVNNKWVNEFKDFLTSDYPDLERKGMAEVSASGNIKKFRTILDRAVSDNLIERNPFKSIKLKNRSPQRQRLSVNEVVALYKLDLSDFPVQSVYRDIFMFSIYTGLAYHDAMNLQSAGINKRPDGDIKLNLARAKTGVFTESFLVCYAHDIINRYKNVRECHILGSVLPRRSNKELNVQLKILANMVGIPFKLTSHIARHTFRQLLAESGIEDVGVIKRMMGQSRRGDVDEVYYSITESRLLDAKNKFETYLKAHIES
ncbi:MAG: site-specific integrase [Chitinophagaceae bacterium]|nr:site-specific integrase [Chitinophagaceae bacterium]